jgi:NAD(P)-dependent dehydrogenase (short-subunit alcohol dehydrogenase family)
MLVRHPSIVVRRGDWRAMNTDLTGKVALVTGGGSGIGEAACHALARAGAAVAVVDLRPGPADAVAGAITAGGGRAIAIAADVTDEAAVGAAVRRAVADLGGLQIVFANAGINGMQTPIEELTLAEWRATIDTNLTGTFLTVKHSIPHLRAAGGGAIVITASVNGTRLFSAPGYSAYSTSKAGQAAFARMAAAERWELLRHRQVVGDRFEIAPVGALADIRLDRAGDDRVHADVPAG